MSRTITATGTGRVAEVQHGVSDGAPYIDTAEGETVYVFEVGATRIAVAGTPNELREFAGEIVAQVDAHEQLQKREAN